MIALPFKQVNYVLRVNGGYVLIGLGTTTGANFDESPFEQKLHTLSFTPISPARKKQANDTAGN